MNSGYDLYGEGFLSIPLDAVGVLAIYNDMPLGLKESQRAYYLYRIAERTNNYMRLVSSEPATDHTANYLGGIVSSDRQTVYWVNNLRPLP